MKRNKGTYFKSLQTIPSKLIPNLIEQQIASVIVRNRFDTGGCYHTVSKDFSNRNSKTVVSITTAIVEYNPRSFVEIINANICHQSDSQNPLQTLEIFSRIGLTCQKPMPDAS